MSLTDDLTLYNKDYNGCQLLHMFEHADLNF